MPFNGSGVYDLPNTTVTPALADTTIDNADFNTLTADLETALTKCYTKTGESVATANLPMGGFKHTGVAASSALTDYARVTEYQNGDHVASDAGGAADVQTLAVAPSIAAYNKYQRFSFVPVADNTGACTLNVSSVGAKSIKLANGVDPSAGDLDATGISEVIYDGTNFVLLNPATVNGQYRPPTKTIAKTIPPIANAYLYALGKDGGIFTGVTGAAATTYSDDGGDYYGSVFIPTGGDGSAAWIRTIVGPHRAEWYGLSAGATGAVNTAAINNCLTASTGPIAAPVATYLLSSTPVVIPAGKGIIGDSDTTKDNRTRFYKDAGDYTSIFVTDETDSSFGGIVMKNFNLLGGQSTTWTDVQSKWGITSHYPFATIENISIEETAAGFFGNGVRLHNDGLQASMGSWASQVINVRFVGTPGVPADNGQLGFDFDINGGIIKIDKVSATRTDIGIWIRRGEDIEITNTNIDSCLGGDTANRSKAAVIVGEPNNDKWVKCFKFTGYIEAANRGFVIQNTTTGVISGYFNALRAFEPDTTPADGFIYITKTGKNITLKNLDMEHQYRGQNLVYSESQYSIEGCKLFRNITSSAGVPQVRVAGLLFGGTEPHSVNTQVFLLDDADTSTAITNMTDSGGEIQVTATAHGYTTGDFRWIEGAVGVTTANNKLLQITVVDANNFTLDGSEFAGTYTSGGNAWTVREVIDKADINAEKTYNLPSIGAGSTNITTVTATGAVLGDFVIASLGLPLQGLEMQAEVTAADTATVNFRNPTGGAIDIASTTLAVRVMHKKLNL